MSDIKPIIEQSFNQYAGAVLQSRALIDSRDCIKPSTRQILYSMHERKLVHNKPHKKTANAVGMAMADYYIHGDASCEGIIMRSGQTFSMRYPLTDIKGNAGSLIKSGNWAAMRYTESRTSALMEAMFDNIEKDTIKDWRDNYDNTKQYPGVLPTTGYYNICNGTFGIGVGMSSSIPQFNLKEVNDAMEKLLINPQAKDEEITPMPDFATGGCLLNPSEVMESLINGCGKACLLRAVVNYDNKENCLVVTEIPYSVYTNTICAELDHIMEEESTNPGIDRYNDLTGASPLIKIYLNKGANIQKVLEYLYKNTSLQYWYSINLTMLDNGKYPKLFTWREALLSHIEHEKTVYKSAFEFDLKKAKAKLNIVEGMLIASAHIDEVVKTIKESASPSEAKSKLITAFVLNEAQAQAILDMKLARITHLEVDKLENEKIELQRVIEKIEEILNNTNKFNNHIINGWRETTKKFGDERRTKITPMSEQEAPKVEDKDIVHLITSGGELICVEPFKTIKTNLKSSPYYKKNVAFGYKTKLLDTTYFYDKDGNITPIINAMYGVDTITNLGINPIGAFNIKNKTHIIHVTNVGTIKKSLIVDYKGFKRNTKVAKIREDEQVIFIGAVNDDDFLFMLGTNGKVLKIAVKNIPNANKNTIGAKGMNMKVLSATTASNEQLIVTAGDEKYRVTEASEYIEGSRGGLGFAISENTSHIWALAGKDFYLVENGSKIEYFGSKDYIVKGKTAQGNKTTKEVSIIW